MKDPRFGWVMVGLGAFMTCIAIGAMFSLAVFLQPITQSTGWSHTAVSAAMTLNFLAMGAAGFGWGALSDRIGPRPVVLTGIALTTIGTIPFAFAGTTYAVLAIALVIRGAGLSAVNLAVMVGAFRDLEPAQIPHASSATRIMQQLGGAFGAATLAVILQNQLISHQTGTAYAHSFLWAIAFMVVAAVPAIFLPARASR